MRGLAAWIVLLAVCCLAGGKTGHAQQPEAESLAAELAESDNIKADSAVAQAETPQTAARRRRMMTPVNNAATRTQAINETAQDTSRINAQRRARSSSFVNDRGYTVFVDTVTGEQWVDSTRMQSIPRMLHPLLYTLNVGINIWDPVMRAFGQHYGLGEAWVQLNMHNRYLPIAEVGMGNMDHRPAAMNFTFHVPGSIYFRAGADYNFFYNSNPNYLLTAGVRYGFAPYKWQVRDAEVADGYWGPPSTFTTPEIKATAGWLEFRLGVQVKLFGPLSAGWQLRFKQMLHESKSPYGQPMYIPGYGTRTSSFGGTLNLVWTFRLPSHKVETTPETIGDETP